MSIITKPTSIEKNVPALFTLDKVALASLTSVAANAWYGNSANWQYVTLNYMSSQYGEMLFVRFDATQASPTANWLAPAICQDVFEIVSISITDFANGTFRVPYTELNQSEFLVDMTVPTNVVDQYFNLGVTPPNWSDSGLPAISYTPTYVVMGMGSPAFLKISSGGPQPNKSYRVRIYIENYNYVGYGSGPFATLTMYNTTSNFNMFELQAAVGSYVEKFVSVSSGGDVFTITNATSDASNYFSISRIEVVEV